MSRCRRAKKIVRKDFGFVVGLMTERGPPVHVANGPNAFCRGFEKFIGFNIAPFINRDVRVFQMEQVRHRTDARGDKDFLSPYFRFLTSSTVFKDNNLFPIFDAGGKGFLVKGHMKTAVLELFQEKSRYIGIFFRKQAHIMLNDGHVRSCSVKDMGKFTANGTTAKNDQALVRPLREGVCKEGFGRNIPYVFKARKLRNIGPAPGSDNDHLPFQFFRRTVIHSNGKGLFPRKGSRSVKGIHIGKGFIIRLDFRALGKFSLQAARNGFPIKRYLFCLDANAGGLFDGKNSICRTHKDLRRNAAPVQAGPTIGTAFNKGHFLSGQLRRVGDDIGRARSNEDNIIFFHGFLLITKSGCLLDRGKQRFQGSYTLCSQGRFISSLGFLPKQMGLFKGLVTFSCQDKPAVSHVTFPAVRNKSFLHEGF